MTIDWSRPIEAVHEDGRVVEAEVAERGSGCRFVRLPTISGYPLAFFDNGMPCPGIDLWRIRNVAETTPAPKYPDALVERMVTVLRQEVMALEKHGDDALTAAAREARAIVAELDQNGRQDNPSPASEIASNHNELPAEVDADWKLASALAMDNTPETFPTDTCGLSFWVLRGVLAGRALADADAGRE